MKFIVLSKSSKFKNYCVAGINAKTHKLVRLVSNNVDIHGAISASDFRYKDGSIIDYLDEIDIETNENVVDGFQAENYLVTNWSNIKKICHHDDIVELYNDLDEIKRKFVFGNDSYYISSSQIEQFNFSLQLVKVKNVLFYHARNSFGQNKLKMQFNYNGHTYTNMSVTDSNFYNVADYEKMDNAIILVSMGVPVSSKHYKFVSAIYEINS